MDREVEDLVDEITRRVHQRLNSSPGAECTTGVGSNCDSCRGCHVKRPDAVRAVMKQGADRIAAGVDNGQPASDIARLIDHTLLRGDASKDELTKLCEEAKRYGFATVCVNAANVRYCAGLLRGTQVKAIAVVGFPLGAGTPQTKAYEAREAVRNGAGEIDTVINIGALKNKDYALVLEDIAAVVTAASPAPVKVILETASLSHDEKVIACSLSKVAGAAFVKTSTGFGKGGATVDDIRLMRAVVGPEMGVKASGGVRTADDAKAMVDAGATRLGASASVAIVTAKPGARSGRKALRVVSGGY